MPLSTLTSKYGPNAMSRDVFKYSFSLDAICHFSLADTPAADGLSLDWGNWVGYGVLPTGKGLGEQ